MGSRQRVACLCIVIITPALPAIRVVTKRAVGSQPAFMMPVAVTGVAIQRRPLELLGAMAFLARHDGMASNQRKPGDIVIKGRFAPADLSVTLFAANAKLAFVSIILLMTGRAAGAQSVAIEIPGMASIALDLRMRALKWKFRLVMVEMDCLPLVLIVAGFALGAVSSGVNILDLVAIHAQHADAFVALANMAGGTGDGLVSALERKPRRVVVERLDAAPSGFAVASIAFFAQAPLVRINSLVTVEALSGCLAEFDRCCVTAGARHCSVGIPKREICKGMIECLAVELDDVRFPSLVVGMTMVALIFCGIRLPPVKSLAGRTIRGNVLVTCKAKPRLGSSREGLVTAAALLLKLCMSVNDWPRHNELLE
jgi:hypothetical protein